MTLTTLDPRMMNASVGLLAHDGSALTGLPSDAVLIQTQTASASGSINFTSLDDTTYEHYKVFIDGLQPATNTVNFYWRASTNGGSSYDSGSNYSRSANYTDTAGSDSGSGATGQTFVQLSGANWGTGTNYTGQLEVTILNPADTKYTFVYSVGSWINATGGFFSGRAGGMYLSTTAVDAFQFLFQSGNISTGQFKLYGLK